MPARSSSTPAPNRTRRNRPAKDTPEWEAAKDILAAHRTLARAEKRQVDAEAAIGRQRAQVKTLTKALSKLSDQLAGAAADLDTVKKARKSAAKKLAAIESASVDGKASRPGGTRASSGKATKGGKKR